MAEVEVRHVCYEACLVLWCKYFLCHRSGVTLFGDEEGLDFVSYSQGLLNLAKEGEEWESVLQEEQSMLMHRFSGQSSGPTEKQLRELLAKSLTRRLNEKGS